MTLNEATQYMTREIALILADNKPSIYLYGSVVLDDFRLGWSDIDILVLTAREIPEAQANVLVTLRQSLLERFPGNPYFRLFEGGMLSLDAFLSEGKERTVYWGPSGQRVKDSYSAGSFGMAELLDSGVLLCGEDVRGQMTYPSYAQMRDEVAWYTQFARKYGDQYGWLLDIARGIYTLRTGKVIAKTAAGEWALENGLCPDAPALREAVKARYEAQTQPDRRLDNAVVQRFADVLDKEFSATIELFAQSELKSMNIAPQALSLIRDKDGISVWRVTAEGGSYVMKCFDTPEYRREIGNYQLLNALGVPTLKVISHTGRALVMEDIERSAYRLATSQDMSDPQIAGKIALWYKTLHQNGREFARTHDFPGEADSLTRENIDLIAQKTGTAELPLWPLIKDNLDALRALEMKLARTLAYTDFHFTNCAVARDGSSALIFDYNFFYKSYAYSDIRNVLSGLGSDAARAAFLSSYGEIDRREKAVDDVFCPLLGLISACQKAAFPVWASELRESVQNGTLLSATIRLLKS